MELFAIQNLTFSYPKGGFLLKDLSITISEGEFLLVLGDSGSGKTTFLKQLKPQLTPWGRQTGDILYMGKPMGEWEAKKTAAEIGYVFQNPEHQPVTDKVWHELAFGLENQGLSQEDMDLKIAEMSSYFGIQEWFHKRIDELSGGQKQILNLASILAMNPKAIVLDEPTSQMDPIAVNNFVQMLQRIKEETGIAVIMAEHNTEQVYKLADSVAVFSDGSLIYHGEPRKAVSFLGEANMQQLLPVVPRIYVKKAVKKEAKEENVLLPPITLQEGRSLLRRLNQQGRLESLSSYLPEKESAHYINGQEWSVQLKEVYYRYNRNNKDVLKHLQGRFYKGECFGLLGGNGVGKSTLLNVISGALSPYSGKVKTKGKVSYLPQNPESMFSHDTVIDELFGTSDKYKDLFKMERLLYRHPYDLSGGEQQRLALLILLSREPDVLLLDEPTKGMTEKEKYILGELLQTLSEHGKTIILASHDIEFAAKYTNRCGLMFDGRLTGVKDTKKFFLQNRYYTTTVRRLTRGILENVVLEDEVIIDAGRR